MLVFGGRNGEGAVEQGLRAIDQAHLSERVRQSLRRAILDGSFAPGDRLVEGSIAAAVGVSRAPVREAIKALEDEGLVMVLPRRGAFVNRLTSRDVSEIYTLRGALEALAFRTAAASLTPDQNASLVQIVEEMRQSAADRDVARLSEMDVRFHRAVVKFAGNDRLLQAWDKMNSQVMLLSRRVVNSLYADLDSVPRRHQRLVSVLSRGGADEVTRAIEQHIESASNRVASTQEGSDALTE
jgi:DNA-binding GntR family transcriptional regulator